MCFDNNTVVIIGILAAIAIPNYIGQQKEAKDTADLPEASGESIAREFERYLKRRGRDKP